MTEMELNRVSPIPPASVGNGHKATDPLLDIVCVDKGNFMAQYKALVIRNLTLKKRSWQKTAMEFVLPLTLIFVLALIRLAIPETTYPAILKPHGQVTLQDSMFRLLYKTLHIVPKNTEVENLMNHVKTLASDVNIEFLYQYHDTEDEFYNEYLKSDGLSTFGIILPEDPLKNHTYRLRLCPNSFLPTASQRYAEVRDCRIFFGTSFTAAGCPANAYSTSGFAALQTLIDTAIIQLTTGEKVPLPSVTLQMHPKTEGTSDGTFLLRSIVPLYIVFAWAQFIVYMMMMVVEEKELKIKEGMKMMGLRDSVYWLSWFTVYGAYVLVLALLCTVILYFARVFAHINVFLLFLLFILYGCSSIVFALMMTPFFNKSKVAGVVGNLTQVAFSLLYYLQVYLGDKINAGAFWALGLFSPCAFSLALDKALYFDFHGGLGFGQLWEGDGLPFGGSLIMISIDIILYMCLAYYLDNVIPSEYGTKRKPWFIFEMSFWRQQNKLITFKSMASGEGCSFDDDPIPDNPDLEPVSNELRGKAAVRIRQLKKTFHPGGKEPVTAVDGISLDIYESQITAILGHNGAGKTTLFNLLTGMLARTSGTASIFGLNVSDANDLTAIRHITGVCPQHDILFMTLTPREHLMFFGRVKGIPSNKLRVEVDKSLTEVDLFSKADTMAADLSGGQRRKLSIAIALIGDPKIVFLDEPTAGVDAYSRRRLWTLLKSRKQGKVILLTTHFMDEADILADRKAIMSKGRLRCCGSSLFLKNKFGLGYHLTLVVDDHVDPKKVSEMLQKIVNEGKLARHYGKEMSYILPTDSAKNFPTLFSHLDQQINNKKKSVGVEGYGISMTTLEEVFLTLNEENETDADELPPVDNLGRQVISEKSSSSPNDNPVSGDSQGFAIDTVEVRPSTWRTFQALFKVRVINTYRELLALVFLIFLPLGFTTLSIYVSGLQANTEVPQSEVLPLTTDLYKDIPGALISNNTNHMLNSLESTLNSYHLSVSPFSGRYQDIYEQRPSLTAWVVNRFPVSAGWTDPAFMTINFNDTYVHSIPILLNALSNSLLRAAGSNNTISVFSQKLPALESAETFDTATFFSPMMIGFTFTMMPAYMGTDLVYDREIMLRNLLRLNGVGFHLYFASLFCVMILTYAVNYLGLLIVIAAFNLESLMIPLAFATLAILYLLYMPCALLYTAVFCYIFDKAGTARQFYPSMATTVGFMGYTAVSVVDMTAAMVAGDNPPYLHMALTILLPHYIPFGILYYVNKVYLSCLRTRSCSSLTFSDYMTPEIIVMFVMVLVDIPLYYLLLRLVDTLKLGGSWKEAFWMKGSVKNVKDRELGADTLAEEDDEDVQEERKSLSASMLKEGGEASPVLIHELGKVYSKGTKTNFCKRSKEDENRFVALKSLSLEVKSGQVFGLLGPNGAGKTTTLKIMTAQESPSKGQVKICGTNVLSSLSEVFQNLGYCPQHDALWKNITVAEHVACFAAIKGVKEEQVQPLTDLYLKGLVIEEHKNKKSKDCSGGTKRKLSYVLSMIGKSQVVLLDEPSTGMDPQSKRFLWNSILASFKGDRSAILTTHSMEEADALCSRIGILVRGGLRCIGAIQHLKNKYGGGYSLEFKLNTQADIAKMNVTGTSSSPTSEHSTWEGSVSERVTGMVEETFPNAKIEEQFDERIIYKIPQSDVTSLSGCFSMLEEAKSKNMIQEYALSQTTLEQVFLKFARQQEGDPSEED